METEAPLSEWFIHVDSKTLTLGHMIDLEQMGDPGSRSATTISNFLADFAYLPIMDGKKVKLDKDGNRKPGRKLAPGEAMPLIRTLSIDDMNATMDQIANSIKTLADGEDAEKN